MFAEDELLPLSALQHLLFCERQCALIHLEQAWSDNRLTVEGSLMHQRVHEQGNESRGEVRIARGLALRSLRLGLSGKADVVEFHNPQPPSPNTEPHPCIPFPVEYKRGKPKPDLSDEVQVCAQALCLEEMLGVHVPAGALFYGRTRRRKDVAFTPDLRRETEDAARRLHALFASRQTPKPELTPKCKKCSLIDLCMPAAAGRRSAIRYLHDALAEQERTR